MKGLKTMPDAIKTQLIYRATLFMATLILSIMLMTLVRDVVVMLAGACILVCIAVSSMALIRTIKRNDYIVVEGICINITTVGLRRRVKSVYIDTPDGMVEVRPKERVKLDKGMSVRVFVRYNTRVYLENNKKIVLEYIALEVV